MMRCLAVLLVLLTSPAIAQTECAGAEACELDGRSYHIQPPEDWDGESVLPVLLHYHGWGRTGLGVLRNKRIATAASRNGYLLVAPNGLGKSWSFWSPDGLRDVEFTDAVIADLATRLPIDRARVVLSGFSYGGAMVWRVACVRGDAYAGYLSIAGTLWNPEGERCAEAGLLWHVHGRKDTVMDLPVGPRGDLGFAMRIWRRAAGVDPAPEREWTEAAYACRAWQGEALRFCLHPGGHWIPKDWLALILPQLRAATLLDG